MEEKIYLFKYNSGACIYSSISGREELELWKKDGTIQNGDHVLICKDYEYYKVELETKVKLVKV